MATNGYQLLLHQLIGGLSHDFWVSIVRLVVQDFATPLTLWGGVVVPSYRISICHDRSPCKLGQWDDTKIYAAFCCRFVNPTTKDT